MNQLFVIALLGGLFCTAYGQIDDEMLAKIPADTREKLDDCAAHCNSDLVSIMDLCMMLDDDNYAPCGKFFWCMALKYKFIDPEGNLDVDIAVEESKKTCELLEITVDLGKLRDCAESKCTPRYYADLKTAADQTAKEINLAKLTHCIVEDCVFDLME